MLSRHIPASLALAVRALVSLANSHRRYAATSQFVGIESERLSNTFDVIESGRVAKLSFKAHPHMLRHACGYALANRGHDTRALQAYLGHKNIQHTVRYAELSPTRFRDFWQARVLLEQITRIGGNQLTAVPGSGGLSLYSHRAKRQFQ
jgi:integrase